jgi:hypothetical protein
VDTKAVLGILSSVVVVSTAIPYFLSTLKHKTKPSRATWTLLTLLLILAAFVQGEIGNGWAIALTLGDIFATGAICLASYSYGQGGLEKVDLFCYVLWAITVGVWLLFDQPVLALCMAVAADLISMVPTLIKTVKNPYEESVSVFIGSGTAGFIAIFAASSYTLSSILFPLYLFLICYTEVALIVLVKKYKPALKKSPNQSKS